MTNSFPILLRVKPKARHEWHFVCLPGAGFRGAPNFHCRSLGFFDSFNEKSDMLRKLNGLPPRYVPPPPEPIGEAFMISGVCLAGPDVTGMVTYEAAARQSDLDALAARVAALEARA